MNAVWSTTDWEELLGEECASPIRVVYGRSRTVPVRARPETIDGAAGLVVHLHRMFANAPEQVAHDLARWLRVGRRARAACRRLDAWIAEALAAHPPQARPLRLQPAGRHHDLNELAAKLVEREFAAGFGVHEPPLLTWGRRGRSPGRHSLRLGSYDAEKHLVRIHPVLDQASVPVWFLRYILMHELLHAAHPPRRGRGRRWIHHGREFRRRERAYGEYARALRWEEHNLPGLIHSARTGKPFRARPEAAQLPPG